MAVCLPELLCAMWLCTRGVGVLPALPLTRCVGGKVSRSREAGSMSASSAVWDRTTLTVFTTKGSVMSTSRGCV